MTDQGWTQRLGSAAGTRHDQVPEIWPLHAEQKQEHGTKSRKCNHVPWRDSPDRDQKRQVDSAFTTTLGFNPLMARLISG